MAWHEGWLYMFYCGGYNNEPQQVGLVVSEDGVDSRRLSDKRFIAHSAPGSWDLSESGHPYLFQDDDRQDSLLYRDNNSKGWDWHLPVVPIDWNDRLPIVARERLPVTKGSR